MRLLSLVSGKLFFVLTLLAAVVPLFARDVTIYVEDTDIGIPLEGAVIRSWNGTDYTCDENGIAVIDAPDDRQVSVQVIYPGYETGRVIITLDADTFSAALMLGGVMEGSELVIEADRPGVSETKSGRSVAISGEKLERSSRIGFIEDVMTSVKLLPGVGYTGMFNAMPSIRGGDPGDLMAVLDGFYIENPYHWGGGFSIFDPHMVSSAQLSHGIFSARYGHTVSGLLELSSRKADPLSAELELGLSTSAVNLNAAIPFGGKGGLMAMGKVTYWDPFIWAAQQLSKVVDDEQLDMVNYVTTAPYIRSAEITGNYRFNSDLEWTAALFAGGDGVGAFYENEITSGEIQYSNDMDFNWDNLQSFFITGLTWNFNPNMVWKTTLGAGFSQSKMDANIDYHYLRVYETETSGVPKTELGEDELDLSYSGKQTRLNFQGRTDFDWSPGNGFLLAAGVQELYSQVAAGQEGRFVVEERINDGSIYEFPGPAYIQFPVRAARPEVRTHRVNTSAYVLGEYQSPGNKFGAELGIRVDHLYFAGKNFDIQTLPVPNPRLNLDYNIFRNRGIVESLDITAGTGLFSSINENIDAITPDAGVDDFTLRPNRSWTSVAGIGADFSGGWSFNIEGYYKYVFDRAYEYSLVSPEKGIEDVYRFDGDGIVWGFDLMLQKLEGRCWDGWLSYTFTHAKYHQSEEPAEGGGVEDSGWYYPYFHRFHNLNLVLNFKPSKKINIYTRLGLASGQPKPAAGKISEYEVILLDEERKPYQVIKKYRRDMTYDDDSRTTWSIPLDVKFSYFIFSNKSKVQTELYFAAENLLSLFYVAQGNTGFNTYTGKEETGSDAANYELPIPMVSFGMRWSF